MIKPTLKPNPEIPNTRRINPRTQITDKLETGMLNAKPLHLGLGLGLRPSGDKEFYTLQFPSGFDSLTLAHGRRDPGNFPSRMAVEIHARSGN